MRKNVYNLGTEPDMQMASASELNATGQCTCETLKTIDVQVCQSGLHDYKHKTLANM